MALGSSGERSEPTRARLETDATVKRTPSASRRRPGTAERSADDALRLAVETLSAEICWFVANDAGARGVFVPSMAEPRSPRPNP
jgi:hypothetical protein